MVRARILALSLLLAAPRLTLAQGAAPSLDLDTSVRASGMGGVSNAVYWGAPLDAWANPALLGLVHGVGYEWARTRLVPGISSDVRFRSQRFFVGAGGVGIGLAGWPDRFGSIDLDYGESELTDENGNPLGTFSSTERIRAFSFGVSLAGMLHAAADAAGGALPPALDRFDAGWGATHKDVTVELFPGLAGNGVGEDQGMYVRVTPFLASDRHGRDGPRLDLAFAHSVLNRNDATIDGPAFGSEPTSRIRRDGATLRVVVPGNPWGMQAPSSLPRWSLSGFAPFLEVGGGWDHESVGTTRGDDARTFGPIGVPYVVNRYGLEATIDQMLTVRGGYVDDPTGDIRAASYGFGFQLPIGHAAGIRYDFASVPQATGQPRVSRHSVYAFLDPIEVARLLRDREHLAARDLSE